MSDKKSNRVYTSEFIQEAMQLVRKEQRSTNDVAESLGICLLKIWPGGDSATLGDVAEAKGEV
jgi:transposase-like protein